MSDAVARLIAEQRRPEDAWAGTGEVTNVNAGATPDGRRLVGIRWNGADLTATYLESYTPVLGRRVIFLKDGASFLVIGGPALA